MPEVLTFVLHRLQLLSPRQDVHDILMHHMSDAVELIVQAAEVAVRLRVQIPFENQETVSDDCADWRTQLSLRSQVTVFELQGFCDRS